MKFIVTLFLFLLIHNLYGQDIQSAESLKIPKKYAIKCSILDKSNRKVIEGATVLLKTKIDSSTVKAVITNSDGTFIFTEITGGRYYLLIKHGQYNNYKSTDILLDSAVTIIDLPSILLEPQSHNLSEVKIAAKTPPYIEGKIDRTVINVSSRLNNTATNALEVLSNSPAVEVNDNQISLRGKQGITIYINNKQVYMDGDDLANYLKSIPSSMLDKIELMPIPPAKYHARGNSGVINIITKKNTQDGLNGNITLSHGQGRYQKSDYNVSTNYKTAKVNLFALASYSSNDNAYDVTRNRFMSTYDIRQVNFEKDYDKNYHYRFGLDYDINSRTSLGFVFDGAITRHKENGIYKLMFGQNTIDSLINTQSILNKNSSNVTGSIYFKHVFRKNEELNISADYLRFTDRSNQALESNTLLFENSPSFNNYQLKTLSPFNAQVYSIKTDYEVNVFKTIVLSSGLQTIYSNRNSNGTFYNSQDVPIDSLAYNSRYKEYIYSAYLNLNKEFKRISIQAGIRFEGSHSNAQQANNEILSIQPIKYNYINLLPTLYINYKLDTLKTRQLNFSLNATTNRPNYSSVNPSIFFFDKYTISQGNPGLVPEKSFNMNLSLDLSTKYSIGLTYSNSRNTIIQSYALSGLNLINSSSNIKNFTNYGLYNTTTFKITDWWSSDFYGEVSNVSYNGLLSDGKALNTSLTSFRSNLSNQLKFKNNWSAEVSGSYRTKITLGQGIYMPLWRMNASIQKKILKNKASLTLTGRDIAHSWVIKREIPLNNGLITVNNSNDTQQIGLAFSYRFGSSGKTRAYKTGLGSELKRVP